MSERFPRPAQFLAGGEEMGERLRAYDWAATPLGEPGSWPHALKTLVALPADVLEAAIADQGHA